MSTDTMNFPYLAIKNAANKLLCALYKKEGTLLRAITIRAPSFLSFCDGLSLTCKFTPIPLYKQENHDKRYNKCNIKSHPFRKSWTFPGVCFCEEILPSPAVTGRTEKNIYQASKRQKVIAHDKILQIKDRCSFAKRSESAQYIIPEHTRHGQKDDSHQVDRHCFPS